MKFIYSLFLATLFLSACSETTIKVHHNEDSQPQENEEIEEQQLEDQDEETEEVAEKELPKKEKSSNDDATTKTETASKEKATAQTETQSTPIETAPQTTQNLNGYTKSQISGIVNNTIRPAAYKIKGMVDNKTLAPISKNGSYTTYQVDHLTLIIYENGNRYAEYTYANNQLLVVVPYVNKQLQNRYYYYNNELIYILYPNKADLYRPDFTEKQLQQEIDVQNFIF